MAEVKTTVTDVIPMMTKITEYKLNRSNFLDWSKTIRIYLRSIEMNDHLTKDPPTDETRRDWMGDDARLFLQIRNSIHSEVISLINHCEFVKELMEYLEFLYSGKGNISRIYGFTKNFNILMPLSIDVKTQKAQREQMAIMSFVASLPPEFETAKSHILSDSEISLLHDVFARVLCTESPTSSHSTSALVSRNDSGQQNNRGGQRGGFNGVKGSQRSWETGST
ncbi:hypothetical protein MANES_06G030066v8 [Manihot esculenta]|uniref:Uncharacterized protein n=1 Tax=Manihot esculenta TaxID=3983 RepID=A0ACC8DEZ4_MANES|nr:hypothetical protein MANES_06G030066v8 [Manihot esculenta]